MKNKISLRILFILSLLTHQLAGQTSETASLQLTLPQAIEIAQKQSIESFKSKNMYLSSYWEFRSYRAQNLPTLSLQSSIVDYDQSSKLKYNSQDSTESYIRTKDFNSNVNLTLKQNISATGAVISANSQLLRINNMERNTISLNSTPISIGIMQPINGYNSFRWKAKIEPIKFEIAKRELVQSIESISMSTSENFFNVVNAEINLKIAQTNYSNADTLFRIAKGRFETGTVTQDELLDFELGLLNSRIALTKSKLNLQQVKASFNSFLGLDKDVEIICIIPDNIKPFDIQVDQALSLATLNNPDILDFNKRLIEANERIARTRGSSNLSATIQGNFGVEKNGSEFNEVYQSPYNDQNGLRFSISVPLVDWGARRGQILMAKSDRDVTEATIKQARIDFEKNVFQEIMEFNLQDEQVEIAAKADTIAQMGYHVTKQRFLIDKVDVIKLNSARNSLDAAKRNYIDALRRFWNYYYSVRMLTLFDFESNVNLLNNFDQIVNKTK